MKKIFIILLGLFITSNVFCQEDLFDELEKNSEKEKKAKFVPRFDLLIDIWNNAPDSVSIGILSRGGGIGGEFNFPIGNSNFSFATGFSYSFRSIFTDAMINVDTLGITYFQPIPEKFNGKKIEYKRNKITVDYIDVPVAFIYKTNSKFVFSIGAKGGILVNNFTFYHGDNYMNGKENEKIKVRIYKIKNIQKYRYGITGRIGYKWVSLSAFYSLSNLFEKDKGPADFYPISVGITLMK